MGSRFVFAITEGKNPGDFKSSLRRVWEIVDVIFCDEIKRIRWNDSEVRC